MNDDVKKLFDERLGRYQAAIALEPTDRMPIAAGTNYFSEVYSGNNKQITIYDPERWLKAEVAFIRDFPEVDVLRNNRIYGPLFDAVGCRTYKLPGRDLPPTTQFQFMEREYMMADEYEILIKDPMDFMLNYFLPRTLGELSDRGSKRFYIALLKGGMAHMQMVEVMKKRSIHLQTQYGMPQPMTGAFVAPFDLLGDVLRGFRGIIGDMYRQPDTLLEACEVLVHEIANFALATADPLRRYPIFVPTHKPTFLSPEQFETFYWPSFKKTIEILLESGYKVRAYLEGDWGAHWRHMLELPKGSVVCDLDNQGDIFKALEDIGHHQCVAGGIPDSMFILGTQKEIRDRVKLLCEAAGRDKSLLINGGCNVPYDTRPENYRAMIDAILEFGIYDASIKPLPMVMEPVPRKAAHLKGQGMVTPWEVRFAELEGVQGEEDLIRRPWENLEKLAYSWVWQWVM
jgi:hypothetical protein